MRRNEMAETSLESPDESVSHEVVLQSRAIERHDELIEHQRPRLDAEFDRDLAVRTEIKDTGRRLTVAPS